MFQHLSNALVTVLVVGLAFVLGYGLVAKIATPIQSIFLPEVTTYASLVFLPHGVRILATLYFGWKAIVPLMFGAWASSYLFGPASVPEISSLSFLTSLVIGATCAIVSFEVFKVFGRDYYYKPEKQTHWKQLIYVGILASLLNSLGQVFVYSDHINPAAFARVASTYALGDTIGLIATMLCLMLLFRWARFARQVLKK